MMKKRGRELATEIRAARRCSDKKSGKRRATGEQSATVQ